MVELISFDIDVWRSLRGLDRQIYRQSFREWRELERKKDRVVHNKSRWRFYRETHPEVIRKIRERYVLAQKRKRYIRVWFVMVDKYIESKGDFMQRTSQEDKENKVLASLESGSKDRFSITAECGMNQNTVYLTLKVLEARGAIFSTKIGKRTLWAKKVATL